MADNYLPYQNPSTTDAKLDTESLSVGANTVHRERIQIAGTAATDLAPVSATDGLLVNLGANNDVTVAGVSTAAKQDTIIGHVDQIEGYVDGIETAVDGIEGLLTTIDADTGDIVTSLQLIDDVVKTEDAGHSTGDKGIMSLAVRKDTQASLAGTDLDYTPLQVDASGALRVNIAGDDHNWLNSIDTRLGSIDTKASSLTSIEDYTSTTADAVLADDAAFTPASSSVMMSGFQADEASTDSVNEGDAGAARMTLDRKQIVTPQPHTAGGLTIFRSIDLDESEEEVKGTAGQIYGIWFSNMATSTRFLKIYNATAANVTVGTTTPVITLALPGNSSDDISGAVNNGGMGIAFDTAITVAATTGIADNDTGAPGANEVICNIFYK